MIEYGSVYLVVRDFEKAVDFYKRLLERDVSAQNKTRFAIFNIGSLCLCLLNGRFDAEHPDQIERSGAYAPLYDDYSAAAEKPNSRKVVINLGTPDLRTEYARIEGLAIGSNLTEIRYLNAGAPYWFFSLCDPDGNVLEITGTYSPDGAETV